MKQQIQSLSIILLSFFIIQQNINSQCNGLDYDALVALYNSTNGLIWNVTDCDYCSWDGVICDQSNRVIDLRLSNKGISGTIPPEIGNLTNLLALDLALNQIGGIIPPEIGNLSNLFWLALSFNSLSGDIPIGIWNLINLNLSFRFQVI